MQCRQVRRIPTHIRHAAGCSSMLYCGPTSIYCVSRVANRTPPARLLAQPRQVCGQRGLPGVPADARHKRAQRRQRRDDGRVAHDVHGVPARPRAPQDRVGILPYPTVTPSTASRHGLMTTRLSGHQAAALLGARHMAVSRSCHNGGSRRACPCPAQTTPRAARRRVGRCASTRCGRRREWHRRRRPAARRGAGGAHRQQ